MHLFYKNWAFLFFSLNSINNEFPSAFYQANEIQQDLLAMQQ